MGLILESDNNTFALSKDSGNMIYALLLLGRKTRTVVLIITQCVLNYTANHDNYQYNR